MSTSSNPSPVAVIVTAVSTEREALLAELRDHLQSPPDLHERDGRYLDRFNWKGRDAEWCVYVAQPTGKGPHATSALVSTLVRDLAPRVLLMVGMCGGFEDRVKEGTVIVARQVFNYEHQRLREGKECLAPTAYRAAARVIGLVDALVARGTYPNFKVQTGKDYASGEKLIDDLDAPLRAHLLELSDDIIGFEMEGHALLHGIWELQRERQIDAAVIKGVSDYGDGKLRDGKKERQTAATRNATQVALTILSQY